MEVKVGDERRISNGHRQAMFDEVFSDTSQTGRPSACEMRLPRCS